MRTRKRLLSIRLALISAACALFLLYGDLLLPSLSTGSTKINPLSSSLSNVEAVQLLGHPTFKDAWEYERKLPQHKKSSRIVASSTRRYLRIPHASWGTGWNNVFQEQLLNAYLAHMSDRAYVFPDYIPRDHVPFPDMLANGTRHMLHIPMNAFVAGPIAGGPLFDDPAEDIITRRSISDKWWEAVCPREQVKVLNVFEVHNSFGYDAQRVEGAEILTRWAKKLKDLEEPCVSVEEFSILHYGLIGSPWIVSIWPSYVASPFLQNFAWSPLVTSALFSNIRIIAPGQITPPIYLRPIRALSLQVNSYESFRPLRASSLRFPISGLLGLHVRRGDYAHHCVMLSGGGYDYNAWNNLGKPGLVANASAVAQRWLGFGGESAIWPKLAEDRDVPDGLSTQDALYQHCYPDIAHIVKRSADARAKAPLTRIFIATNGEKDWVTNLTRALYDDGWEHVSTLHDLKLTPEAYAVSHAVDMGILSVLAEEFIGVGFSSLSSNVAQIRLGTGLDERTIHFW